MPHPKSDENKTSDENLLRGFNDCLTSIESVLAEKMRTQKDTQARADMGDFLRFVRQLQNTQEQTRFISQNKAEIIEQTTGTHLSYNLVAQRPFSDGENTLLEVVINKSNEAGIETFELSTTGDTLALNRRRVDKNATPGGTWERSWEL